MNRQELSKVIAEKLDVYISNPKMRCVTHNGQGQLCRYASETLEKQGEGCIVGAFLTLEDRLKADMYFEDNGDSGVEELINKADAIGVTVPDFIKDNDQLFISLQSLHDIDECWNVNGLTDMGTTKLRSIITRFDLDKSLFEKYLVD